MYGKIATGKETLQKGAQVAVFFSDETLHKFMQDTKKLQEEFHMLQRLPMKGLSIIYEDTDILIADKPYNMLSQKAKEQDLSANEYLLGYLIRSGALSLETFGTFRPSVCNRLDRNTTGLLLMGKTLAGAQMLSEGLRERTIHCIRERYKTGTSVRMAYQRRTYQSGKDSDTGTKRCCTD